MAARYAVESTVQYFASHFFMIKLVNANGKMQNLREKFLCKTQLAKKGLGEVLFS
jgi:hypothetical protein